MQAILNRFALRDFDEREPRQAAIGSLGQRSVKVVPVDGLEAYGRTPKQGQRLWILAVKGYLLDHRRQ